MKNIIRVQTSIGVIKFRGSPKEGKVVVTCKGQPRFVLKQVQVESGLNAGHGSDPETAWQGRSATVSLIRGRGRSLRKNTVLFTETNPEFAYKKALRQLYA